MDITNTLIYYFIAYLIVTTIASLHFVFNWKVRKQQAFDTSLGIKALKENATQFEAFRTTKPFHPLYNILVFPVVAVFMMKSFSSIPTLNISLLIGLIWIAYCIIFDLIFWFFIPHPWRLTLKELFITYQPWILLAYIAIGISPIISFLYLT